MKYDSPHHSAPDDRLTKNILATAVAGLAASAIAPGANAAIISNDSLNYTLAENEVYSIGGMNGVAAYNYRTLTETDKNNISWYNASAGLQSSGAGGGVTAGTLVAGVDVVGAGTTYPASWTDSMRRNVETDKYGSNYYASLIGAGSGIYGVSFDNGAGTRYGWVDIAAVDNGAGNVFSLVVKGYGYEDSGASIIAGATTAPVPEPDTLAMMALGGLGLAVARRRQRAAQAGRLSH